MKVRSMETRMNQAAAQLLVAVVLMTQATAQTRRIVVSIPDHKLALIQNGEVKKVYPVATGKPQTPSPTGSFHVANRVVNPTYYHEGKVVEPGSRNPVGTRWIGLNEKGYGIHGTNAPSSIGKSASHGCIRMAKKDLEELFELVRPGDPVEIRGERDELTASLFEEAIPARTTEKPAVMAANEAQPRGGQ